MSLPHTILLAIGAFGLALADVRVFGSLSWAAKTCALEERLDAGRGAFLVSQVGESDLDGLPAQVQRFFRLALPDGAPMVSDVAIRHRGVFNMGEIRDQWRPFTSRQRVVTNRPGFVWDGRVSIIPGVQVHVHDAYVGGEGVLNPAVLGILNITDLRGTENVAQGELMRYLAEAAWYPTALLSSQGVRWEAIDETSARAHLVDGDVGVSLVFKFGEDGLIQSARADARGRAVGREIVPTPWEGRWRSYQTLGGMRVPTEGEVAWVLPDGARPCWRGTVTRISFTFAESSPAGR